MLDYNDIFVEKRADEEVRLKVYKYFYKDFSVKQIEEEIGRFEVTDNKIISSKMKVEDSEKKIMRLFRRCKKELRNSLNGKLAVFVDEDLGMPLIGLNFFGIIDKGSEMIEIKPITGCNADCCFCSVDEGFSSKKNVDFVVEVDFLMEQLNDLLSFKSSDGISIWINPHGEPLLYEKIVELCDKILETKYVKEVHIVTNGILLEKKLVDELEKIMDKQNKSVHISLSLSAIDPSLSKKLMGSGYNPNVIIKNMEYAVRKLPLTITPVLMHSVNEEEIKRITVMAKKLSSKYEIKIGIQNFCSNKHGRNPVKEISWEDFFGILKEVEKETECKLITPIGKIQKTRQLPELCKKGDVISVKVLCNGRNYRDKIGIYEARNGSRAVALVNCKAMKGTVKARVLESKYNMILAK